MPVPKQVNFFKGDVTSYLHGYQDSSHYVGGIFFDTTNKDIYLNGEKYTEGRFMIIDSTSITSAAGYPYIVYNYTSHLGSSNFSTKLPTIDGSNAIDASLNHTSNDFEISLKLYNPGSRNWLTQDSSGLKFNENILDAYIRQGMAGDMIEIGEDGEINHKGIDVSIVNDISVNIDFDSTNSMIVVGQIEYDDFGHIKKIHPASVSFGEPVSYWNEID